MCPGCRLLVVTPVGAYCALKPDRLARKVDLRHTPSGVHPRLRLALRILGIPPPGPVLTSRRRKAIDERVNLSEAQRQRRSGLVGEPVGQCVVLGHSWSLVSRSRLSAVTDRPDRFGQVLIQ